MAIKNSLNLVHVITGLGVGGAEHMLARLAIEQRKADHAQEITVISLTEIAELGVFLRTQGITVYEIGIVRLIHLPFAFLKLMYLFVLIRPDVVQTWLYHADLLGGLAARSVGVRNVLWGIRTTDIKSSSFNLKLVRWVLARLSGVVPKYIICAAEAAKKSHIRIGYDAKKMIVISNGYVFPPSIDFINGARFLIRQNLGIIDDHIVVGSMGRFHSDKDHENFVKAAILLLYKFPKLQFLMVGCDVNSENSELMSLIDFSGFRSNFLLLGQRNDPQACFSAMDIFCLHSRTEAFPNVLVEAMGSGIPCVATNVGDAELILSDTGVLVPKEDYFALANGLASLISLNKEELRDLGLRARASVEARFSIRNAREQFDVVYSRTMKNRSF